MKKYLSLILLLPVLIAGCKKEKKIEPVPTVNCSAFASALLNDDYEKIKLEVNSFFDSGKPMPDMNDEFGYKKLYNAWVHQIEACPNLKVSGSCYECYQTYPLTSAITIEVTDSDGQTIKRTLFTSFSPKDRKYGM